MLHYGFFSYNNLSFEYKTNAYSFKDISLSEYYSDNEIKHIMNINDLNQYKKFTIVRNIYHRFISGWKYMVDINLVDKDWSIITLINSRNSLSGLVYNHIFMTQSQHIGTWEIDEIGHFESLELDLQIIFNSYGFKKKHIPSKRNKTTIYGDPMVYFTPEILRFINEHFDEDFRRFGYTKIEF